MNKKAVIISLVIFSIFLCLGVVVAGIVFIPKLINTFQGGTVSEVCEITNCHGLDIKCGSNPPDMCTEEYQIGDNCRQFATCQKNGSSCTLNPSEKFSKCKSCVEKCVQTYKDSSQVTMQFACAETCFESGNSNVNGISKIANPSASYCTSLDFEYDSTNERCRFDEEKSCDAWDFYRGKCMKENSYCEQMGNKLSTVRESTSTSEYEYALCTFDDGSVCAEEENFRNNCVKGQCKSWNVEEGGCVN